jgi:hypothetical protein
MGLGRRDEDGSLRRDTGVVENFFYCGERCGVENARHTFVEENCGEMVLWLWRATSVCLAKQLPKGTWRA